MQSYIQEIRYYKTEKKQIRIAKLQQKKRQKIEKVRFAKKRAKQQKIEKVRMIKKRTKTFACKCCFVKFSNNTKFY